MNITSAGLGGYSLLLIQKQDEDEKQCCHRRRILIVDDELDIAFTFNMVLEENAFNKQVDTYNEPLLALQNFKISGQGPDGHGLTGTCYAGSGHSALFTYTLHSENK